MAEEADFGQKRTASHMKLCMQQTDTSMGIENLLWPHGVQIIGSRDIGKSVRFDFTVDEENLHDISSALEKVIREGWQLFVNDHSRGDSEGGLIIERVNASLRLMRGGHGYSSDWGSVSIENAVQQIELTLEATKWSKPGGHFDIPHGAWINWLGSIRNARAAARRRLR